MRTSPAREARRNGRVRMRNGGAPREGLRRGRAGTPDGVGTAEADVLTQDRLLGRVKEREDRPETDWQA